MVAAGQSARRVRCRGSASHARTEECGACPLHGAAGGGCRRRAEDRPRLRRSELEHARRRRCPVIARHPRRPARCAKVQVRAAAGAGCRRRHVTGAVEEGHARQAGREGEARVVPMRIVGVDAAGARSHHAQRRVRAQQRRQQRGINARSLQRRSGVGGAPRRQHPGGAGACGIRSRHAASERPRDGGVRSEQRCGGALQARRLLRRKPKQLGRHAPAARTAQVAARRAGRGRERGVDAQRLSRRAAVAVQQRATACQLQRRAAHQR